MATRFKVVLIVVLSAIVLLCAAGWYALHNPDRYLPRIIADLQQKTGLQMQIQHIEVRLFPTMMVRVYGLEVKNPKPFPAGDFLKVPRLDAVVEMSLLLRRQISIRSLVLDQPVIDFISDPDGLWNFQNPARLKETVRKPLRFSMGSIASLEIKKGTLLGSALVDPADTPGPVVFEVANFSAEIKQINFNKKNSASATVAGNLDADTARFGDIHLKTVHSQLRISPQQLTFKNFKAATYRGQASGDFTFNFSGKNPTFNTDLKVSGIGVPYLLREFQSGPAKMTGMMQADLKLAGEVTHTANPLAGIEGGGHFTIRNGGFPSLNGSKSMAEMKRFRSSGAAALPVSAFSSFAGDMELRNHHIYNRKLGLDFYGIDVDGSGNLDEVNGGMDYRGTATILKKQGFFTNVLARVFKGADLKKGKLAFPIRVAGTLTKPVFSVVD